MCTETGYLFTIYISSHDAVFFLRKLNIRVRNKIKAMAEKNLSRRRLHL